MATLVNPYSPPVPLDEAEQTSYPIIVLIVGLVIVITALAFVAPGLAVLLGVLIAPAPDSHGGLGQPQAPERE